MIHLALARFRGRWSAASLIALSVAAAVVVLGSLLAIGTLTTDIATRRALGDLGPMDRVISIHRAVQDASEEAESDRIAEDALRPFADITEPMMAVTIYESLLEPQRVVAVEDASRWVTIVDGRLPAQCAGTSPCEAMRIGVDPLAGDGNDLGRLVTISGFDVRIVGVAAMRPDAPLEVTTPGRLVLLIDGRAGLRDVAALAGFSRTSYWLASIDPASVHSWDLADMGERVDALERRLAPSGPLTQIHTPERTIEQVAGRTAIANGRFVFISSLIVGVLLAFAAFAAAMERSDVGLEDRRLRAAGAAGPTRLLFLILEAALPAAGGLVVGEIGAAIAVTLLASSQGVPIDAVLWLALLQPAVVVVMAALVGLAIAVVFLGIHPRTGRLLTPRIVLAATIPAGLLLVWSGLTGGAVGPTALARGAASPSTIVLPGAVGLAVIAASLVVLPPLLRGLVRVTGHASLDVRLAAISLARSPLRPAAVMTLLAFSVAAVAFGQVYSSTVRQGAADQAAFRVGSDLRIDALGIEGRFSSEVLPLLRDSIGPDVDLQPMVRLAGISASRRDFVLAGIDGEALSSLRGWRSDFSAQDPATLGAAINLGGAWQLPGSVLAAGAREVTLDITASGDPIRLSAIVEEAGGRVRYVPLGDLVAGRTTMRGAIFGERELAGLDPSEPSGWRVVGLIAAVGGPSASPGPLEGRRQQADVLVAGLDAVVDPATPIHLDVSGARSPQLIRGAARTDDLILPAIVSPELAGDVDSAGTLFVRVGSSLELRLHPVGLASHVPTILDPGGLIVVDLEPLLLAMNANEPGTGVPNRALLRTSNDERTAELAATVSRAPYPPMLVESRPATEQRLADDPFAMGLGWALAIGGLAALALSIAGVALAAATELRDSRGELWELEARGVAPRSLTRMLMIRTLAMCLAGAVVGVVAGLTLSWFAASALAAGADGTQPIPSLQIVAPWPALVVIPIPIIAIIAGLVFILARSHFGRASLGGGIR